MRIEKTIFYTTMLLCSLLSSCGLIAFMNIQDAFEAETISTQLFREELDFEEINGFIIIQVEFRGQLKNFIFDTGATTSLDQNLAAQLNIKTLGKVKTFDSNNTKQYIPYVTIEEFNIGNISFYNTVASISDMEKINTAACIEVSGIIGSNAMKKCIWQIDYRRKKMVVTNDQDRLGLSGQESKIHFSATSRGTPTIALYSNERYWGEVIFDTGSNGGIALDEKYLLSSSFIVGQSYNLGVHGEKIRMFKISNVSHLDLDHSLTLENQLITFGNEIRFGIIGNKFLKDYKVTIDWTHLQILLEKYDTEMSIHDRSFDFYPRFIKDRVIVGSILLSSPAYEKGLRLNDQIIAINDLSFKEDVYNKYCQYLQSRSQWEEIKLTIQKGDEKLEFISNKRELMELLEENN
ncbi:MAG: aspartyl protease family protein [Bacteroidota bacterium]